ncbi:sensor histidine kinase [Mycobacterium conspicuum]|uniref:histidine kinase n=1 Tax=Mycobacterium conspicuum TaxID=44010 RepID=A0A1X1TPW9_9MYCO|nr:histidine kinase [Mycobacterium conspicuum]ORV46617.1 histidine kinase [Mycobacterium conspicuum]BBZ40150.1 hypothetical protein MCNS_32130 [Mycobacterium conspicuum]
MLLGNSRIHRYATERLQLLGYDLVHRYATERFEIFLVTLTVMYFLAGVLLPLWGYEWVLRSLWVLAVVAICTAQCAVLVIALYLVRRDRHQRSITLVCVSNWVTAVLITFIMPSLLPVMVLLALVPVVFAEHYVRRQRGLILMLITVGCVLALAVLARFQNISQIAAHAPPAIESVFINVALPIIAVHILLIVWNNAAALRVSQKLLADHAAELAASRTRLITAADEERRRLERDLHDGAQQHLVALAVLLQLARRAEKDRAERLLLEASELMDTAIAEIRRIAHGIYPPLLVSGGLAQALPAAAAHAAIPVDLNLQGVGRYRREVEAALYYCSTEALQNAAKHGGPDAKVAINASVEDHQLTLVISDSGPGFNRATTGAGLTNMKDRLAAIGGQLEIDTAPGRGTRIIATVTSVPEPSAAQ